MYNWDIEEYISQIEFIKDKICIKIDHIDKQLNELALIIFLVLTIHTITILFILGYILYRGL